METLETLDELDGGQEPGPLRIVKRPASMQSSTAAAAAMAAADGSRGRRPSADTDESLGSMESSGVGPPHPLTIPKKRRTLPSRLDGGAGRFLTASAASSAAMARRRLHLTDRFEPESDGSQEDSRGGDVGRYPSIRTQFLRDARGYGEDMGGDRAWLPEGGGAYQPQHPYAALPRETGQQRPWHPDALDDVRRQQASRLSARSFDYSSASSSSRPGPGPPYADAAGGPLLDLFPPDPYERAATANPFAAGPFAGPYRPAAGSQLGAERFGGRLDRPDLLLDQLDRCGAARFGPPPGSEPEKAPDANPQMLVPVVSVTPECRTVEGQANSFWVAIELSAQLVPPLDTISARSQRTRPSSGHGAAAAFARDDQGLYRFGYISGLDIKIVPSFQSEILEVIGQSSSLLTLLPGSRRLLVVHVHLDTAKRGPACEAETYRPAAVHTSSNGTSDKLMEDLERQLGSTSQEYMQIQLTYAHSGFPKRDVGRNPSDRDGGGVEVRTTIETTVTALVMQQNASSLWSPAPAPASSPLVDIVAKHWGPSAAKEMAKRIATSIEMRMLRRSAAHLQAAWSSGFPGGRPTTPAPNHVAQNGRDEGGGSTSPDEATPRAAAARHQANDGENNRRADDGGSSSPVLHEQHALSQPLLRKRRGDSSRRASSASQSQSQSRHWVSLTMPPIQRLSLSSANVPAKDANANANADPPSPGCLLPGRPKAAPKTAREAPRQPIPDAAPRNIRRPAGTAAAAAAAAATAPHLENLMHGASEQSFRGENCEERLVAYHGHGGLQRSSSRSSTASKRSGKWSWSGWFS